MTGAKLAPDCIIRRHSLTLVGCLDITPLTPNHVELSKDGPDDAVRQRQRQPHLAHRGEPSGLDKQDTAEP